MIPLYAEVALVPLGGSAPRRTLLLESHGVLLGVGPGGAMSSGLSLGLFRKLSEGTAVATASVGKATAFPPPAEPSAADVAVGLALWPVNLLTGLVWRGGGGRGGILSKLGM